DARNRAVPDVARVDEDVLRGDVGVDQDAGFVVVAAQGVLDQRRETGVGGDGGADALVPQGEAGVVGEGGGDVGSAFGEGVEVAGVGAETGARPPMEASVEEFTVVEAGGVGGRRHDTDVGRWITGAGTGYRGP